MCVCVCVCVINVVCKGCILVPSHMYDGSNFIFGIYMDIHKTYNCQICLINVTWRKLLFLAHAIEMIL